MPGVDFDLLRREIAMRQVLDLIGFKAASVNGDQLRGPCPIHGSTSPNSRSFSVNLASGRFRCFRCGSCGNQLELWAAIRKLASTKLPSISVKPWGVMSPGYASGNRNREEEPVLKKLQRTPPAKKLIHKV